MTSRLELKKHDYEMTLNRQENRDVQPQWWDGGADTTVAPWKHPNYSFPKLSPDMTLNAIYDFALQAKIWFQSGGDKVPPDKVQYSHLMNSIPPDMWIKLERVISPLVQWDENIDAITHHLLKSFPLLSRRAQVYNDLTHDESTVYIDKLLEMNKQMSRCNFINGQTFQQAMLLLQINMCKNEKMSK